MLRCSGEALQRDRYRGRSKPLTPPSDVGTEGDFDTALEEADEVRLTGNLTLTHSSTISRDFTIDLNGHDIQTGISSQYLFIVNGGKLTLKGSGTLEAAKRLVSVNSGELVIEGGDYISNSDVAFTATGVNSKITMNGGTITAVEGGLGAFSGAQIELNGGEIEILDNFAIFTNGTSGMGGNTIVMNGGSIIGNIQSAGYEACGVYIANNDSFTMNDGTVLANNGAGLCMRGGTVTINGGSITSTGEAGTTGKIADYAEPRGKSGIIYDEAANYPGKSGMSLTINGGIITGVDHSLEILSNEEEPAVTVTGGTFEPAYPEE